MSDHNQQYLRFTIPQRVEHFILILSFTLLAITGLPQKYAGSEISQAIISLFGGIELARIIHRVSATVFVLQSIYHFVVAGYKIYVRRLEASMVPGMKDAKDAIQSFSYNLGMTKEPPKMPRYNFMEKLEYLAMIWGLVLMGITGFMLWNPIITARILPGVFIPAAKIAHGLEAVLAVLAIIIWHFYNVHIKAWNWSMIRGTMDRHQMEHEHGEELQKIERGEVKKPAEDAGVSRRRAIYIPIATIVSLALVGGIVWLLTVETTAIETVPPPDASVPAFSPRATATLAATAVPAATQPPAVPAGTQPPAAAPGGGEAAANWDGGIGALFQAKCLACHGTMGGYAVDTYANAVKGGASGNPGIVPGSPDASQVVVIQQAGHMGQFSEAELQQVIDWISAGAPEN